MYQAPRKVAAATIAGPRVRIGSPDKAAETKPARVLISASARAILIISVIPVSVPAVPLVEPDEIGLSTEHRAGARGCLTQRASDLVRFDPPRRVRVEIRGHQ